MRQSNKHFRQIEQWALKRLTNLSREELILAFDRVFLRVWAKAVLILGKVTLQAVLDRVAHVSSEKYPWLAPNLIYHESMSLAELLQEKSSISDAELKLGLSFFLGEFLTVIGSLTAEIITPQLHAALLDDNSGGGPLSNKIRSNKDTKNPVAKGEKK